MQIALFVGLLALVLGGIGWVRVSARRATPEETRRALAERSAWIMANRIWLALAFGGGAIALTGLAMWVHAMLGETVEVELARVEAGEASDAAFVRAHGHARGDLAVCRESRGARTCHTPLTSTPDGARVAVILSGSAPIIGEGDFAGMAWADDVWGLDELAARGLVIVPGAFVLLSGETPEERRPIGLVIAACGALLCAAGTFVLRRSGRAASLRG